MVHLLRLTNMAYNSKSISFEMDLYLLKIVRNYNYFCRFEVEKMSKLTCTWSDTIRPRYASEFPEYLWWAIQSTKCLRKPNLNEFSPFSNLVKIWLSEVFWLLFLLQISFYSGNWKSDPWGILLHTLVWNDCVRSSAGKISFVDILSS